MSSTDDSGREDAADAGREEVHQGYDLESGVLSRLREWVDLFPALRLARTLRAVGSPSLLLVTAITLFVWWLGIELMLGSDYATTPSVSVRENVTLVAGYVHLLIPTSPFDRARPDRSAAVGAGIVGPEPVGPRSWWFAGSLWVALGHTTWSLLVWTGPAMFLTRQGALLTAGRSLAALAPGISLAMRRTPEGWIAALVPLACILPLAALMVVLGWVSAWFEGAGAVTGLLAMLAAAIALPCGLLAFGANVAVPISWAALVNQDDTDPLDALSRGYEYLFRRPLQLVFYVLVSLALLLLIGGLACGVAWSAAAVATTVLSAIGSSPAMPGMVSSILWQFPPVVLLTLLWSLVGGVYLLLRHDAGSQEVEDLWQPAVDLRPSLPELPEQQSI